MADHGAIIGFARRQPALRGGELGAAELEPRLGLGDVGPGHVADLEPVAGRLEVGLEHPHVVLVQFDDRPVADHVHVGRHRLGEDVALDCAQLAAAGVDPGLGRVDRIADAAAVEQRYA